MYIQIVCLFANYLFTSNFIDEILLFICKIFIYNRHSFNDTYCFIFASILSVLCSVYESIVYTIFLSPLKLNGISSSPL